MNKTQILNGFVTGILANSLGLFIVGFAMSKSSGRNDGIMQVLEDAHSQNFLGKLIRHGAILNLLCFF